MAVVDSYSESNQDAQENIGPGEALTQLGQSFTGDGSTITSAQFYLDRGVTSNGNVTVSIYAHTGTFGVSSARTGSALATSDSVAHSAIPTSFGLVEFNFTGGNQITLANGTNYVAEVVYSGTQSVTIGEDSSSPTHPGNSTGQAGSARDVCFYINSTPPPPKVSQRLYLRQGFQ